MAKRVFIGLMAMVLFFGLATTAMAYSIRDDATGGDCTQIGVWDAGTKTCTLTRDLYNLTEGFVIDSDGITFDGNGHSIIGTGFGSIGIQLSGRKNVTVENLIVTQFEYEIILLWSSDNIIAYNTIENSSHSGIVLGGYSHNNIVVNNNSMFHRWFGIYVGNSYSNTLSNNTLANNQYGVRFGMAETNMLADNSIEGNNYGVDFDNSDNNIVTGNTIHSGGIGIALAQYSAGNKFYNNHVNTPYYVAISVWSYANNNVFYNNNILSGGGGVGCGRNAGNNIFSLDAPIGGNYWNTYDASEEGCNDANNDGFCDSSYTTCNGIDYYPWTKQDGWVTPDKLISSLTTEVSALLSSGAITSPGVATSLTSTLENALFAFEQGNAQAAENMLQAFINKVEAQTGKQITAEAAAILIEAAKQIINKMQ